MKHFFDKISPVDPAMMQELLRQAREELKKKQMNITEMRTHLELICFNSSTMNDYVPKGMDQLIGSKNILMESHISTGFTHDINKSTAEMKEPPFGYVLANIQVKGIEGYLDMIFDLNRKFEYEPPVVTHFSDDELLEYLGFFLKNSDFDGLERKIEVFEGREGTPWRSITDPDDLIIVDKGSRRAAILDRPFFSDIQLKIKKNNQFNVFSYPFGKLRTIIGHFNRQIKPGGVVHKAKSTLFISWKDIDGFKIASSQSKILLGISLKGEFIPSNKFISNNIGLNIIKKEDIDYFALRIGRERVDVKTDEIKTFEINLDSLQVIVHRGITKEDFHISRFKSLKLVRGDQSVLIQKVVPFNRGKSNFEQIQTFFGTRYTEFEKVRQIRETAGDLDFLATRNVVSCDHIANLVLSSMSLLGVLPLKARCIGFSPEDIKNKKKVSDYNSIWFENIKTDLTSILDLSETPNYTDHNFSLRTKNIKNLVNIKTIDKITTQILEDSIDDLENLTRYMDKFFKLDLYNQFEDNLECDIHSEVDTAELEEIKEYEHLDSDAKDFIGENFIFFRKRERTKKAILGIEQMLFYTSNVKKYAEDDEFEPDLVVYSNPKSALDNYQYASYPAISLAKVINPEALKNESPEMELEFVKFMRGFTKKVFDKAFQINESFHHQYKHTLAELRFHLDEKKGQLTSEIEFLENPKNKEAAYERLLDRVTNMFLDEVKAKEQNIEALIAEEKEVRQKMEEYKTELGHLTRQEISDQELPEILKSMPERLEEMRMEILKSHNKRKKEISNVFTPYVQFNNSIVRYFTKVQNYANLFQKALWIHQKQQLLEKIKESSKKLAQMPSEKLEKRIEDLRSSQYDIKIENNLQGEIDQYIQKIRLQLEELKKRRIRNLFNKKGLEKGELMECLNYFENDTKSLVEGINKLQTAYLQMNNLQNSLFKKQAELINTKIQFTKNDLLIKVAEILIKDPRNQAGIDEILQLREPVPKEIKEELNALRSQLNESIVRYKKVTLKQNLAKVRDYQEFFKRARRRDKINGTAKELVNFTQGLDAIAVEILGEKKDLAYLKTQEGHLESFVMSKTLPSTKVLLKTQYLPLVEQELKLLERADLFLGEILSKGEALKKELSNVYFAKRHNFQQFGFGYYCYDSSRGTRNHTEKNISAAHLMLSESYKTGFSPAAAAVILNKIALKKIEVIGTDGVRSVIKNLWKGSGKERVLFLPPTLKIEEVLDLCDVKEMIIRKDPRISKSRNTITLVYIGMINFEELRKNESHVNRYHRAIMSNIFINIDDANVYNNKQSIFEAIIGHTLGNCNDNISSQVYQKFLYGD